jgi:hypothetical protein
MQGGTSPPPAPVIEPIFRRNTKTSLNRRTCFRLARLDTRPSGLAGEDRTTATSALQNIGKTKTTLEGRRIGMLVADGSNVGAVQAIGGSNPPVAVLDDQPLSGCW